jgi:hypothetical protein
MPLERFVIEELGGLNRNLVDGLGKQPDELKNLKFDKMGGWRYYGAPEVERTGLPSPFYQSVNRYGVYFDDATEEYHFHDAVTDGLSASDLTKDLTVPVAFADTGVSIANADGSTNYFVAPRARYGPFLDYMTGVALSPDEVATPAVPGWPEVTVTWTAGTANGDIEYQGHIIVGYAAWVQTKGGKYVFKTRSQDIYPLDFTPTPTENGRFNFEIEDPPAGSVPTGVQYGVDIYIEAYDTGFKVAHSGFLGGGVPGEVIQYSDFANDLVGNSEIFVDGRFDLAVSHQGRYYYVDAHAGGSDYASSATSFFGLGYESKVGPVWDIRRYGRGPDNIVVYSEAGPGNYALNATRATNFFVVSPEAGAGINALMSSPAGLMVFCENEIFLFRGDPVASSSLVRYSGTIGNTPGSHPVSLAGVVFNVWGGHVYMHSLGMGDVDFGQGISRISDAVYLLDDPFINLYADQENNQIIAETEAGLLYVYDAQSQSWFEHQYSGGTYTPLNYGGGPLVDGNLFYEATGAISFISNEGAAPADLGPSFKFSHLDFGDKRAHKLFRSVEVFTNPDWSSTASPTMTYQVGEMSSGTTVNGVDLGSGRWVFRLEPGASGARGSFEFSFPLMAAGDVIEPPIVFNYVPKGRRRI